MFMYIHNTLYTITVVQRSQSPKHEAHIRQQSTMYTMPLATSYKAYLTTHHKRAGYTITRVGLERVAVSFEIPSGNPYHYGTEHMHGY